MRRCLGILLRSRFLLLVLVFHSNLAPGQTSIGAPFPIATNWAAAGGAFDGTDYLVGLVTDAQTANVAAQLVSQTGARVGPLIALGRNGQTCCVAVAFDGTNYLMVWEDDQGIKDRPDPFMAYGQFISTAGVALGQPFAITDAGVWLDGYQFLAYGGGRYLITYTRLIVPANGDSSTNRYLAGRIISPDGTMGSEFRISSGFGAQSSIDFDGTNFFVTWVEDSLDYEVRGRFVSPTGTPGQEISINASPAASDSPSVVAFDGTNYLVVFHDAVGATPTLASLAGSWVVSSTNDTYSFPIGNVFTVDASGNYTSTLPGCTHTGTLSVSGNTFAMHALTSTSSGCIVPGTTITGTMEVTATTLTTTVGSSWALSQRTAGQATGTMAAWDVFGQRVSPAGALVGGVITISNDPGPQLGMGIAFDGTNYLVSWTDMQDSTNWDVYGRFVSRDGVLIGDRFAINTDAGNQMGGVGGYANGKYFGVVNSGVQFGASGAPTQVGDASGLFLGTYPPTQPDPSQPGAPDPTQPVAPPPTTQTAYMVPTGRMPEAAVTTVATGTLGSVTLSVSLDLSQVLSLSFAGQGQFAEGYNVYVFALVPGAALGLPAPLWFVLPATRAWAALSVPVPAFLQGVAQGAGNRVEIPILESINMTSLLGTEFYVGYGTDEFNMVATGRYRGVYKVQ